jgi:hypothetical protein
VNIVNVGMTGPVPVATAKDDVLEEDIVIVRLLPVTANWKQELQLPPTSEIVVCA